jgi:hypothetical protein
MQRLLDEQTRVSARYEATVAQSEPKLLDVNDLSAVNMTVADPDPRLARCPNDPGTKQTVSWRSLNSAPGAGTAYRPLHSPSLPLVPSL